MRFTAKIRKFGKIKLPKETLEKLQLEIGDHVFIEINKRHPLTEKTLSELENLGIPTSRSLYALKNSGK